MITPNNSVLTAQRRLEAIEKVSGLIASGWLQASAVRCAGISEAQFRKWRKRYEAGGFEALVPPPATGRPPKCVLSEDEVCRVKERIMGGMSEIMALREACMDGEIRGEVARVLLKACGRKHDIPGSVRRQIKVPEAVRTYHHSPRDFRLRHISTPRRNVTIENGVETPDEPGDAFVFDDMTVNFAWWTPWPLADSDCSKKFGVKVTRGQLLACIDLVSLRFIHFALLARVGESYQANDIWAEYGRIFRTIGKPRKAIIHEGGHWTGKHIHGEKVRILGADEELRIGGLQALGVKATRSWSPKTKPIEGRFDFLQTLMEGLPGNLGRAREGQKEWKIYNRCAAGTLDPREYLPSQTQMADMIAGKMARANNEPLGGRLKGTPDALWDAAIAARPLVHPPADMGWIFARDARLLTVPAKPPIRCVFRNTNAGEEIWFDHDALLLIPIPKLRVMVHFDPLETNGEAVITSADPRSFNLPPIGEMPARTVRTGDMVCVATRIHASARITDEPDGNIGHTKKKVNAVRTEVRRIGGGKSRAEKMAEAYNGAGGAGRIETGTPMQSHAPAEDDARSAAHPLANPRHTMAELILPPSRQTALPAAPAWSSRPVPATAEERAAEIAKLAAALEAD